MAVIAITFVCGHQQDVSPSATGSPSCVRCGELRVSRVKAPPPSFTGHVHGPYARTKDLGPTVVDLTTEGPLKLKPQGNAHE